MLTPTILHLIRTIALMVLGWLPFQLGNTGDDQPDNPTWNIVDLPPYPQIILGYTNQTLWYPYNTSNPSLTPWVKNPKEKSTMFIDYETPWITERLEADSWKSLLPFILASDTRRAAFKAQIDQPKIPQYIKDNCLFSSLAVIGLLNNLMTTPKQVFGKPLAVLGSSDDFIDAPKQVFGKPLNGETSQPYGVGLLNMHALLKFFTSEEAGDLKVTPSANEADKQVRVAVVDTHKLYYSSSLNDTTASSHYPMFDYVNDANASFNDPPGHSFLVSQVLFSPNTSSRDSSGNPINRNPFIVGAVYSSQLMHRQAWIRNQLPEASSLRLPDQRDSLKTWTLPLISKDGTIQREFKIFNHIQVTFLLGQLSSSLNSSPIRAQNTMIAHANPTKTFCGWFSGCLSELALELGMTAAVRKWQLDRKNHHIPPAPHLINLSMGWGYDRRKVENKFSKNAEAAKEKYNCGGKALQNLLKDTQSIIVRTHPNDPNKLSEITLNCPYVLGVAGYDMYASIPDYIGHAPIARSHDFYFTTSAGNRRGTRISTKPRSVSVPYGRPMQFYIGTDTQKALNPLKWPFEFVGGNSFSAPLVAGLVAEIMAYWPGRPAALNIQTIYDLLNYGSWRRAYPHDGNELPLVDNYKNASTHSDPIINYPCVMASALLANLNSKPQAEKYHDMQSIYDKLGPAKAFSIFGGLKCDPPYQKIYPTETISLR
jgi:hypothetical protein